MAYFAPMKARWILLFLLWSLPAAAQSDEVVRAALYLTGAAGPEDLDERFLEELDGYRSRPLRINRASRLKSTGRINRNKEGKQKCRKKL